MKSEINSTQSISEKTMLWHCTHCRTEIAGQPHERAQTDEDAVFCCRGCEMVYGILAKHRLGRYYKIKNKSEFFSPARPVEVKENRFRYLEDSAALEKYAYGPDQSRMNFYIEGIHCVACLWLMEHLPSLVPGVESAEMQLENMILKVTRKAGGSFAETAEMLAHLGYEPHPLTMDEDAAKLQEAEDKKQLLQVGVAGFCAANTMFVFICIYAGISGKLLNFFRYYSFFLFLPVVIYSAQPFYRSAWAALRSRHINIDVPVTAAILLGSTAGLYNLVTGSSHIYFDSLSVFVFLLLGTRFFLKKLHQKFSGKTDFSEFLIPAYVTRVNAQTSALERVALERIEAGDHIQINADEVVSVDGEVADGESFVDCHMLNGESLPVAVKPGSQVFAGTVNQGEPLRVMVQAVGCETRLAQMIQKINETEKPGIVQLADRLSKWYLWIVFAATAGIMLWFIPKDFSEGLNRALSLIIVACPCALALATPLAYSLGLRMAARLGVLLKGPAVLEKIAAAKTLFLDKTGTLTYGQFDVLAWQDAGDESGLFDIAYALELESRHPIALAIKRYVAQRRETSAAAVSDFKENLGRGVSGYVYGHYYEIKSVSAAEDCAVVNNDTIETEVGLFENGVLKVRIRLGDALRSTSAEAVRRLKKQFDRVELISGDRQASVQAVANQLGIEYVRAEVSPEEKQSLVQSQAYSMMVGDGANDALALSSAYVSAAVQGSLDISFRCADIYFLRPGIEPLAPLIEVSHVTKRTIYRNLIISLIYNTAGVGLALAGWVTPLVAAVIMPLSSFSVLLSSVMGTHKTKEEE